LITGCDKDATLKAGFDARRIAGGDVFQRHQKILAEFVASDLDLGFMFLQAGQRLWGTEHGNTAVSNARSVLESAHLLLPHIEDPEVAARLRERAEQLEVALRAL
jgi:hypothetical protein